MMTTALKNYYRLMLGPGGSYAASCFAEQCIGVDFGISQDLTPVLTDNIRSFNQQLVPLFLQANPNKSNSVAPNIDFYRYQIHFELLASKGSKR